MPNDPELSAETREWLEKAANDLANARKIIAPDKASVELVLFLCQQAAEKCFKAYLTYANTPFSKTHNFESLLLQCEKHDATIGDKLGNAVILSEYAWQFRYPGHINKPGYEEATAALKLAQEVYSEIESRLPEDVLP